jgi:hypothetical protein
MLPDKADTLFDKKMKAWWTEVVENLDRIKDKTDLNITVLDEDLTRAQDEIVGTSAIALFEINAVKAEIEASVASLHVQVSLMGSAISLASVSLGAFSLLLNNVLNNQYSNL